MERWKETQLQQLLCATEINNAYRISLGFAKNIGFKFFAFSTSFINISPPLNKMQFNNYPAIFSKEYEEKKSISIDPVVAQCNQSMMPVLWHRELFSKTPWLWESLENQGLQHGWSQSIHDEVTGFCSILSLARSHCPITAMELYETLGFSGLIGRHLHLLNAQLQPKLAAGRGPPHLSQREIDVLTLAADGKTAGQTAIILNVTPRTVSFHMQSSILKFGVNNKTSAVMAAMKAGLIFP